MRSAGVKPGEALTVLAACFGERPERAWLRNLEADDDGVSVAFVDSRAAVIKLARTLRPRVVLLPLRDAAGISSSPLISRLREEAPGVRVLLLMSPEASHVGLAEAIRAGGEVATLRGEPDLRAVLLRATAPGELTVREDEAARALLSDIRPAELRDTILFCVLEAHRRLSARDLAGVRGKLPTESRRRACATPWPNATELICWGRLVRASLLQWGGPSSLHALAQASGFRSAGALQRSAVRLLQRSIGDPRDLAPLLVTSRLLRRVQRATHDSV
jgi:hypothetical protein